MNEGLFDELVESVKEGGAILRGDQKPSRRFVIEEPDVKGIRENYNLSQSQFASLLHHLRHLISINTADASDIGEDVVNKNRLWQLRKQF